MAIYPKIWHETERYLTYGPLPEGPGLLHLQRNLDGVCLEALLTNRIPVLPKNITLPSVHNPAGFALSSWDRYWDIKETKACLYCYNFSTKRMTHQATYPVPVLWVDDLDDWINRRPHKTVFKKAPVISHLDECKLVYRKLYSAWWSQGFDDNKYTNSSENVTRKTYTENIFFHRKPAAEVWAVVDDIVKQLGADFWAIHIRRNDALYTPENPHATDASKMPWIIANLECAELDKDTPLFVMTDEKDPLYLRPLKKKFNIILIDKFKSFQDIISKYPGDNFLHFYIERLIYFHAKKTYKTAKDKGDVFMHFPEPTLIQFNRIAPHYSTPVDSEEKYFSYLALERKSRWLNKYPSLFPARYYLAQKMLHLKLHLRRYT